MEGGRGKGGGGRIWEERVEGRGEVFGGGGRRGGRGGALMGRGGVGEGEEGEGLGGKNLRRGWEGSLDDLFRFLFFVFCGRGGSGDEVKWLRESCVVVQENLKIGREGLGLGEGGRGEGGFLFEGFVIYRERKLSKDQQREIRERFFVKIMRRK